MLNPNGITKALNSISWVVAEPYPHSLTEVGNIALSLSIGLGTKCCIFLDNTLEGYVTQKLSGYFTILLPYPESFSIIQLFKVVIRKDST